MLTAFIFSFWTPLIRPVTRFGTGRSKSMTPNPTKALVMYGERKLQVTKTKIYAPPAQDSVKEPHGQRYLERNADNYDIPKHPLI